MRRSGAVTEGSSTSGQPTDGANCGASGRWMESVEVDVLGGRYSEWLVIHWWIGRLGWGQMSLKRSGLIFWIDFGGMEWLDCIVCYLSQSVDL